MQRLAAPMIGGMLTAPLLSLLVMPALYKLLGVERLRDRSGLEDEPRGETAAATRLRFPVSAPMTNEGGQCATVPRHA